MKRQSTQKQHATVKQEKTDAAPIAPLIVTSITKLKRQTCQALLKRLDRSLIGSTVTTDHSSIKPPPFIVRTRPVGRHVHLKKKTKKFLGHISPAKHVLAQNISRIEPDSTNADTTRGGQRSSPMG